MDYKVFCIFARVLHGTSSELLARQTLLKSMTVVGATRLDLLFLSNVRPNIDCRGQSDGSDCLAEHPAGVIEPGSIACFP